MSDVYAGGVPASAGSNLHPKSVAEAEETQAYGGEKGLKTTRGGPAEMNANKGGSSFLNDSGYSAGDLEAGRPGGMKTVNPDDISH